MEVAMKSHISDKTNWRQMLTGSSGGEVDLVAEKRKLAPLFPQDLQGYISPDDRITRINYPVEQYPQKVRSLNFDKEACIEGTLTGIKGQYLLFEDNGVVNLRKYGGYLVRLSIPD
jgi:hypothetical protein